MTDFFNNEFTREFNKYFSFQSEIMKQALDLNKKLTVEFLKNSKVVVDTVARNIDNEIKRLDVA